MVFLTFVLSLFLSPASFAGQSLKIAPEPSWVIPVSLPTSEPEHLEQIQNGVSYHLLDIQIRVPKDSVPTIFKHTAVEVMNPQGLDDLSQIDLYFHPEYEQIVLHSLIVHRDGKDIDKASTARVSLLEREDKRDDLIYNGEKNYNLVLDDVRVGDVIEYAYSITGANPVFQSNFSYSTDLNWGVPLQSFSLRLLWEKPSKLYSQLNNTDLKLSTKKHSSSTEYLIQDEHIAAVNIESNSPSWFNPWSSVQFSQSKNWSEVAKWENGLYADDSNSSSDIKQKVAEIRQNFKEPSEQIQAALRFVQDEVRYLGIELGENSHRPSPASSTFKRRYGDCKDKTVLFIALLKQLGFNAYPALVNTGVTYKLKDMLPSARSFDHVITYLEFDNKKWWLDPTRNYQYGNLSTIHQPDYGYALIVKPDTNNLSLMSHEQSLNGIVAIDNYFLPEDLDKPIKISLDNIFRGWNAEKQRRLNDNKGIEKLQKNYLEYIQYYYPNSQVSEQISIVDNEKNNTIQTVEKYTVDGAWNKNKHNNDFEISFFPYLVREELTLPDDKQRNDPLYLPYPKNIQETINLYFENDGWAFESQSFKENNDFFDFEYSAIYDKHGKHLTLSYSYSTKKDHVEAQRYSDYLKYLENTKAYLSYGIYRADASVATSDGDNESKIDETSFITIFLSIYCVLLLLVILLWRLDKRKHTTGEEGIYFPVSSSKLVFMWLCTFGIYGCYWFYKNFQYVKSKNSSTIKPFVRGFFCYFWFYSLWTDLQAYRTGLDYKTGFIGKNLAFTFAFLFFCFMLLAGNNDLTTIPFLVVSALLVLPLAHFIHDINKTSPEAYEYNSKWRFRHILLGLLTIPLLVSTLFGGIGLMPSDEVIKGEQLWDYQKQNMVRKGIISPDDRIKYFYSDAFLFIGDDGNGITQNQVFSYWKEDGRTHVETARFSDIDTIDVQKSKNLLENSIVTINRKDGSNFYIFISSAAHKDRLFISELRKNLN